jgi:hypothetical protein
VYTTEIVSFAPGDNGIPIYKNDVDGIPTSQAGVSPDERRCHQWSNQWRTTGSQSQR